MSTGVVLREKLGKTKVIHSGKKRHLGVKTKYGQKTGKRWEKRPAVIKNPTSKACGSENKFRGGKKGKHYGKGNIVTNFYKKSGE